MNQRKEYIQNVKRVVLKIGTKVLLTHHQDNQNTNLQTLISDIANLRKDDYVFSIVTSGAVGFGMNVLNVQSRPTDLKKIQACASVGQSLLMQKWNDAFEAQGIHSGQILLTYDIIESRKRYLYARDCVKSLLDYGAIPIVNENDSVAIDELKFGDNDTLSALTAILMDADLLILFTDTEGVFDKNPHQNTDAKRISFIHDLNEDIYNLVQDKQNDLSLGGMTSKLQAAERCIQAGTPVIITNGYNPRLKQILNGEDIGTFIKPVRQFAKKRKRWIFFNHKIKGKIIVDAGAANALINDNRSLLPGGVIGTERNFAEGSLVGIFNTDNKMIGKGITYYTSQDIEKIKGQKTDNIQLEEGKRLYNEIIHRDNMIIL